YRSEFYSWTTDEQIDLIQKNGKVLIKSKGSNEVSIYQKSIEDKPYSTHALANILRQEKFQKKRFAWTSAWPICSGERDYGSRLLKIKLKDEALICIINPYYPSLTKVVDINGREYSIEEADSLQSRIAAVHYINDIYQKKRHTVVAHTYYKVEKDFQEHLEENFYREYVLINEYMIEVVDHGSDHMLAKVQEEIDFLEQLLRYIKLVPEQLYEFTIYWNTSSVWNYVDYLHSEAFQDFYFYNLAFPQERYDLFPNRIEKILKLMKSNYQSIKNAK
ncbi:hypothetical protein JYT72_03110, partial [Crocinitomix catalasitica]|nr:hypothetical protein [Crocinitomix catalasitica]